MFSNRATFAALAMACIAAAGAGGYFASRQTTVSTPAAAMTETAPGGAEARTPGRLAEATGSDGVGTAPQTAAARAVTATPAAPSRTTVVTSKRSEPARAAEAPIRDAANARTRQDPPVLDRPSPASVTSPQPVPVAAPTQAPDSGVTSVRADDRAPEPPIAPSPAEKAFEELVVSANSVVGLQTESRISSETARVEDRVEARVTRDVKVADKIAIPAGSRAVGSVILVERGGKFKERARIGIRFTTLVLPDGTRLPMSTETISREGEDPSNGTAAKIGGGAIAGTILGAILGGSKGAAAGAAIGAGGGAVAVEAGERNAVTLPAGSPLTVRLVAPLTVTIEEK